MRKFLAAYRAAKQTMADAARAAAEAKAGKKKGGKKAKGAKKEEAKGKTGDKKKVQRDPVQEAWASFLAELDERINKQKRCNLEDIYRGVGALDASERRSLACAVVVSNNKKVLPIEGQNANSMNIREALFSAAAAFDAPVDRAGLPGLATLLSVSQRGATEETLMQAGFFKPADLLKAGCARADVAAACVSMPGAMRTAGLSAGEHDGGPLVFCSALHNCLAVCRLYFDLADSSTHAVDC
ncbi:hypothetical protein FOA52_012673 [Chlamydomonas sp. UWO 241]|nr:hypothetical protein FOA52_012673 [Chlamydomonas sp. UWO 241]